MNNLDGSEKSVLREFEIQNANTIELPINDHAVASLIHKGILESISKSGEYSVRGVLLPCIIPLFVKKHITPEMIGIQIDISDEEQREFMNNSRPKFIDELDNYWVGIKSLLRR